MIVKPVRDPITVHTRAGNPIPNTPGLMLPEAQARAFRLFIQDQFNDSRCLIERKGPTGLYNCHGLTFLLRRGLVTEENAVRLVLADDEYYEVPLSQVQPGDIILYLDDKGEIDHSGIVVHVPSDETIRVPWILSKWGMGGEYIHRYNYVPYQRSQIKFMREGRHDEQTTG